MKHLPSLSRRSFVRSATIAGVGVALFGLHGCAPGGSDTVSATYTPGTYTAQSQGKFGPITVETVFSDHAIESVSVVDHEETALISDRALEEIPASIAEHQSLAVDTITGATLSSMAVLAATEDCVIQAGGDPAQLQEAPLRTASTGTEALEAEIVIVGAGGSGMACAVAAAKLGVDNIIVLEKSCTMGGNALVSGGYLEYVNAPESLRETMTDSQRAQLEDDLAAAEGLVPNDAIDLIRSQWAQWQADGKETCFDSIELQALQYTIAGEGDFEGNMLFCQNIADLDSWLCEDGFEFKELVGIVGYSWPRWASPASGRCGQGYFQHYRSVLEDQDLPVSIMLNTPATELLTEGDTVVGVKAQGEDGTAYEIRAKRGVVLATGGFSGNPDMLRQYNTQWPFDENSPIPTTNTYGHTGDGINMALSLGAGVALMDDQMPFPMADCKNSSDETTVGDDIDCMMVNKNGLRFMDEVRDRYSMTADIMQQPEQMMFMITDADTCRVEGDLNRYGHRLQSLIDQGQLFVADTIEELAQQIECDPQTLESTVQAYNQAARSGKDEEFGRTSFSDISPIENPPFYASPRTWAMHITVGGLLYDDNFNVTTEDGTPIPGLYAVGETIVGSSGVGTQGEGLAVAHLLAQG
ncbi:FAD-dependent oxidoreductase [Adlercreutzia equolifaciens]|uniref:FAD-dependent oxidoreductase n=1 Tax=Adlercreutzia equolifaciens TaxID=446660 RepID=UPI0023B02549|nr:FAD-dependent oxidoreductase [Adlercreutzia equolifaciens]MDE8703074.1 FAD-dependent oxidoreductase [Adlercreutzia equolifaciens]